MLGQPTRAVGAGSKQRPDIGAAVAASPAVRWWELAMCPRVPLAKMTALRG